jgi:hypothetical protein
MQIWCHRHTGSCSAPSSSSLPNPGEWPPGPAAHSRLAHKRNWRNGVWERWRPCAGVRTFFTINQGHALRARQVRPCPADRRAKMRKSPGRTARAGVTSTGRSRGEQGDAPTPGRQLAAPSGLGSPRSRRCRRSAGPAPPGRRYPLQRASPDDRACKTGPGRPPRAGHSAAAQRSSARALRPAASASLAAQAHTLA